MPESCAFQKDFNPCFNFEGTGSIFRSLDIERHIDKFKICPYPKFGLDLSYFDEVFPSPEINKPAPSRT